jgi:hypothetical protein
LEYAARLATWLTQPGTQAFLPALRTFLMNPKPPGSF